jgi:hypothetical protein
MLQLFHQSDAKVIDLVVGVEEGGCAATRAVTQRRSAVVAP